MWKKGRLGEPQNPKGSSHLAEQDTAHRAAAQGQSQEHKPLTSSLPSCARSQQGEGWQPLH